MSAYFGERRGGVVASSPSARRATLTAFIGDDKNTVSASSRIAVSST
jgi:hypothetical protein